MTDTTNDWKDWPGGEQPVPDGTRVEVQIDDGRIDNELAQDIDWNRSRVVRYRVIREAEKPAQERGWLIEMPIARWGTAFCWRGVGGCQEWGSIDDAVRFARKVDAETVIESLKRLTKYRHIPLEACEHIWG